jgi:hypothetical protein
VYIKAQSVDTAVPFWYTPVLDDPALKPVIPIVLVATDVALTVSPVLYFHNLIGIPTRTPDTPYIDKEEEEAGIDAEENMLL